MTPAQCRAARALIGWTQTHTASVAGLGVSTVADFELDRREVSAAAVDALRVALEKAGVVFIDENGMGAGVRLKAKKARPA